MEAIDLLLQPASTSAETVARTGTVGRSTRGASKQRRDQINRELQQLRAQLPLAEEATRERLFLLQVMALACVWCRKHALLYAIRGPPEAKPCPMAIPSVDQLLPGHFVLSMTEQGKLLCLAGNFHEDPAFCTDEFLAQGDTVEELVDPRDHAAVARALGATRSADVPVAFVCRWRAPKVGGCRRHTDWDGRPTIVSGRFMRNLRTNSPRVFAALGRSLNMPGGGHFTSGADPSVFRLWLSPDLHIRQICPNAAFHMAPFLPPDSSPSLYHIIHPSHVPSLAGVHRKLLTPVPSSTPHLRPVLLELITDSEQFSNPLRLHAVFGWSPQGGSQIEATCQVLSDHEWTALLDASWLYTEKVEEDEKGKTEQHQQEHNAKNNKKSKRPKIVRTFGLPPNPEEAMGSFVVPRPMPLPFVSDWTIVAQQPKLPRPLAIADCAKSDHNIRSMTANKPDLNNNSLIGAPPRGIALPSIDFKTECRADAADQNREAEEGIILHELPTLIGADQPQLPELDDRDLDEFFRQVEEEEEGRGKRRKMDEEMG